MSDDPKPHPAHRWHDMGGADAGAVPTPAISPLMVCLKSGLASAPD